MEYFKRLINASRQHEAWQNSGGRGFFRAFIHYSAVVPGRPLSLVTVAKFNISARGKFSTGRTQQLFPGCVNIGSLVAIL
jgi:hypothetical protein